MREAALKVGFDIRPVSIFRSYEQQLTIWNEKAQGIRPLLDINGKALDYLSLSPIKFSRPSSVGRAFRGPADTIGEQS